MTFVVEPTSDAGRAVVVCDVTLDAPTTRVPGWGLLEQNDGQWQAGALLAIAVAGVGATVVNVTVTPVDAAGDGPVDCPQCDGSGTRPGPREAGPDGQRPTALRCRLCWGAQTVDLGDVCDVTELAGSGRATSPVLRPRQLPVVDDPTSRPPTSARVRALADRMAT